MSTKKTGSVGQSPEILRELGNYTADTIKSEVGAGWNTFWEQMGINLKNSSSEKSSEQPSVPTQKTGDIFNLASHDKTETKRKPSNKESQADAAINYFAEMARSSERTLHKERNETKQTMQELLGELRRLASSSKVLQMEFAQITVEQAPTEVGKYHVNFLEWMLLVVRAARQKVEDSGAWLASVKGKKGKKDFWSMSKQHGTSFSQASEGQSLARNAG